MPTAATASASVAPEDDIPSTSVQHQIALAKTARAKAASAFAAHLVAAAAAAEALQQACAACGESQRSFAHQAADLRTTAQRTARKYA
jgi:hypothetical protein